MKICFCFQSRAQGIKTLHEIQWKLQYIMHKDAIKSFFHITGFINRKNNQICLRSSVKHMIWLHTKLVKWETREVSVRIYTSGKRQTNRYIEQVLLK